MLTMHNIAKEMCTGCSACASICPERAVSMAPDEEGFLYPAVDKVLCRNCAQCRQVCPASAPCPPDDGEMPEAYAGWCGDDAIRRASSSGGIFSLLAEEILADGGVVAGVELTEDHAARHVIIASNAGLPRLRGAKYLESNVSGIFPQMKKHLEAGQKALFSGTPCQVHGLRRYLGEAYPGLLLVDVMCHGVPSPLVFQRYLAEYCPGGTIVDIKFRDKPSYGRWNYWERFRLDVRFAADSEPVSLMSMLGRNIFINGYLAGLYTRPSCAKCPVSRFPRSSDMTLGDFRNPDSINKYREDLGTGICALNTEKGRKAFAGIQKHLGHCEKVALDVPQYARKPASPLSRNRALFFKRFHESDSPLFYQIQNARQPRGKGVCLLQPDIHARYGALYSSLALQRTLTRLGFDAATLDMPFMVSREQSKHIESFRRLLPHYARTEPVPYDKRSLNDRYASFITGGEAWNQQTTNIDLMPDFFLDFVLDAKNMISYAAGFGNDFWQIDGRRTKTLKLLLERFTAVSVREKSSAVLCDFFLGRKARVVLDPLFLLTKDDYDELLYQAGIRASPKKHIALLHREDCVQAVARHFADTEIVLLRPASGSPVNWLRVLAECEAIVTDDYYGVAFAGIFEKDLYFIQRNKPEQHCAQALLDRYTIRGEAVSDGVCMYRPEKVFRLIAENKESSLLFLEESLA